MADQLTAIKPILLCGGSGTRLWPLSRESFPKQFVPLIKNQSLFELTLNRVMSFARPVCVVNEEHKFLVKSIMDNFFKKEGQPGSILLEPKGRNTAAAMASVALMPSVSPSDLLLFLPSDHYVPDIEEFIATVQSGIFAANHDYMVTFGIQPTFPSIAYGYIRQGNALSEVSCNELMSAPKDEHVASKVAYKVDGFIEKPSSARAQKMLSSGDYLWNAGIFLCKASILIKALSLHSPDILKSCKDAMESSELDGDFIRPDKDKFLACRSESIDYAVMEDFEKIAVIPFKGAWTDVGSWNSVAELSLSDDSGNRISGQGVTFHARNTYINAPYRPVVALGTDNLVIVDTPDAVLVASSDRVEQVKELVAKLKKDGVSQAVMHRRVARPWGWYDSVDAGDRFQVKRIVVKPGASLSLQLHNYRAEHWIVVKGTARVTNDNNIFILEENQSTYIPIGVKHRLENPGKTDLEMIEVQSGTYLGEDDIVRFDDTYGRI